MKGFKLAEAVLFEGDVVVVVEVVEADDGAFGHLFEETFDEVGADEAGRSGYKNVHIILFQR